MMKPLKIPSPKLLIGKFLHLNYRHYICIGITLGFLALSVFYFTSAPFRIGEAFLDLWTSLLCYIAEVFDADIVTEPTVLRFTSQPFKLPFNLPNTWEEFQVLWGQYWQAFINTDNISAYFNSVGDFMYYLVRALTLLMPALIIFILLLNRKSKINNDYNKDSKPLRFFKRVERWLIIPVYKWIKGFIGFIKENALYIKIWAWIWAFNFNVIAIVIAAIAFYLYFIAYFDFVSIYIQVLKLLADLSVMINFIPLLLWIGIALLIVRTVRKNIGLSRLNHMEHRDRGFINERPVVLMLCGTMGKKKTTMITDIALSEEIMFRDKAFEKILECDLKFPFFPWINFENALKNAMDKHGVYNLATARRFVRQKKKKFYKRPYDEYIFGYDYLKYGYTFNDNLKVVDIWEVLEIYAQLYFVYVIESSLLISNYSIRTDNIIEDLGNFPLWNCDLFEKDSRMLDAFSRHSHILDFDSLRLGRKLVKNGKYRDSFEFGVINITEIGKERGNNLELQQVKKNDDKTNQKNDLFNSWLKMVRHSATIDNFPFVKIIVDEQRPESWGADARDLCEIVHIDECSDMRLSMPLFALEELVIDFVLGKFVGKYYKHRFERGDNTLFMYLFHTLASVLNRHKVRVYNQFGYFKLKLMVEQGTQNGELKDSTYYLMCKKIYSRRFCTDCFSDFFNEKALRSKVGINDLPEFENDKASSKEMKSMKSYFFNDIADLKKNK